jgi:hypothetical protein
LTTSGGSWSEPARIGARGIIIEGSDDLPTAVKSTDVGGSRVIGMLFRQSDPSHGAVGPGSENPARRHLHLRLPCAALLLGLGIACSDGGSGTAPPDSGAQTSDDGSVNPDTGVVPSVESLEIRPGSIDLRIDGVSEKTATFQAFATRSDDAVVDVTNDVVWSLSNSGLGRLVGRTFVTQSRGGTSTLTAELGTIKATAAIQVTISTTISIAPPPGGPALPDDPTSVFDGATENPSRAPTLVYPNDDVVVPANLGALEVHFRKGNNANTLFEVRFQGPNLDVAAYQRCAPLAAGCVFQPDDSFWSWLSDTTRGGAPFVVTVRGVNEAGTDVGTSNTVRVHISAGPVLGGLYYWSTTRQAVFRVDFNRGETPEKFFPLSNSETGCFGCHALSRNGKKMTLSQSGINAGQLVLLNVETETINLWKNNNFREQFQSWNPTSDKFAAVYGDGNNGDGNDEGIDPKVIRIRDGNTAQVLETISIGTNNDEPDHPDWSPRGDRIAFARVTRNTVSQRPQRAGIDYIQFANGSWGAPVNLVPAANGLNRYYPTYAPDAQFLLYNESICPGGDNANGDCDGDADTVAKLWAIGSDGGTRVRLDRANGPGMEDGSNTNLSNTFPKWAPFVDVRFRQGSERVMWFTFSSRRRYGLRPSPPENGQLLWMTAIDPDAVLAGEDGSAPAFALPFQDLDTSNHIAQWTAQIVRPDPGGNSDGGTPDTGACPGLGDPCDPTGNPCCDLSVCRSNGPGIFVCRPDL